VAPQNDLPPYRPVVVLVRVALDCHVQNAPSATLEKGSNANTVDRTISLNLSSRFPNAYKGTSQDEEIVVSAGMADVVLFTLASNPPWDALVSCSAGPKIRLRCCDVNELFRSRDYVCNVVRRECVEEASHWGTICGRENWGSVVFGCSHSATHMTESRE
jgi:hypothetical protein